MQHLMVSIVLMLTLGQGDSSPETPKAKLVEPPVSITVESTLPSARGMIRQFAFDGDPATLFVSDEPIRESDHFTMSFDRPVALKSVAVVTGRPDSSGALGSGTLEVSEDGKAFCEVAKFASGEAHAKGNPHEICAIRVKSEKSLEIPLIIREFTIESEPSLVPFKYPVEIQTDVSDAPEMKEWLEKVARLCERNYRMINEELKTEGYTPAREINMTLKKDYRGVAAAGGTRITGSAKFFKEHPDDVGAMIHETTHVVQHYRSRNNPGWLVEGVADYVRFFKFEPGKIGPINTARAHYNSSYRVTAAFLAYLTEKYDKEIVLKLNKLMREGNYKEDAFKEYTGKTVQELDEEWRSVLSEGAKEADD